ncbi:hypothetical protein HDU96_002113 [Phlyctochytrium bullatum]|nr:hypothetical protein HDU96_002113 [Phlyctochytrium bullatum]
MTKRPASDDEFEAEPDWSSMTILEQVFATVRLNAEKEIPFYHPCIIKDGEELTWIQYLSSHDLFYYPFNTPAQILEARRQLRERMRAFPDLGRFIHRRHRYVVTSRVLRILAFGESCTFERCPACKWIDPKMLCGRQMAPTDFDHWSSLPEYHDRNPLWDPAIFGDMLTSVVADPKSFTVRDGSEE